MRLMLKVVSKLFDYQTRCVSPHVLADAAVSFDNMIRDAVFKLLTPDDRLPPPDCSPERLVRAAHVMCLPTTFNGLGIIPVSQLAAINFWTARAKILKLDNTLLRGGLSLGLGPELELAYDEIVFRAGDLGGSLVPGLLPPDALQLLTGAYKSHPKAGKLIKNLITRGNLLNLTQLLCLDPSPGKTASDVIRSAALTGSGVVLQATKHDRWAKLSNDEFVNFTRSLLGLPMIPRGNDMQPTPGLDHVTEACPWIHRSGEVNPRLQPDNNHAMACNDSAANRHALHNGVQAVLAGFARRADYKVILEPKTWELVGRKFTEEQIRRLFPKSRGSTAQDRAAYDAKLQVLLKALEARTQAATPQSILDAQELIKRAIDDLPARNPAANGKNGNILRLDYQFIDPVTRVEEQGDVTAAHVSCASYQAKELKNAQARLAQRLAALAHSPSLPDFSTGSPSPTLSTAELRKAEKYQLLMRMVRSQAQNNERGAVNFVAFAFSTSGELCPAAVALVERIVQTYRRKLSAEGPRDDGLSTAHLTHLFRFEFHVAIQVAIARGVSKVQTLAGLPLPLSW